MTADRLPEPLGPPKRSPWARVLRWGLVALGFLLVIVGLIGSVLPLHLGVPILVIGLIVVLRNSFNARRRFVVLQRRHPKYFYPLRRLLRKDPQVLPVIWHQVLRLERLLPRRMRFARRLRRRLFGRGT